MSIVCRIDEKTINMRAESQWVKLMVEGLGPVAQAEVTIKPITLIIGKNCFGKSLLIDLMYLLSSTLPNFDRLKLELGDKINSLIQDSFGALKANDKHQLRDKILEQLELVVNNLGSAIGVNFQARLREILNVDRPSEIFTGKFSLSKKAANCTAQISDDVIKMEFNFDYEKELSVAEIFRSAPDIFNLNLNFKGHKCTEQIRVPEDIFVVGGKLLTRLIAEFMPLSFGVHDAHLLCDSKAGILRLAHSAIESSLEYGRSLIPARESAFLASYLKLARRFKEHGIMEELRAQYEEVLAELGLSDLKVRFIGGRPEVFIKDRWGRELLLENAPSGIREIIPVILALGSKAEPCVVYLEEVEVHLHPRALAKAIGFICNAVFQQENPVYVIMSTHNPITLSVVNNLILKNKGLHEYVNVVYLKEHENRIVSEELELTEEGFDESVLGEIFTELLEERSELM